MSCGVPVGDDQFNPCQGINVPCTIRCVDGQPTIFPDPLGVGGVWKLILDRTVDPPTLTGWLNAGGDPPAGGGG